MPNPLAQLGATPDAPNPDAQPQQGNAMQAPQQQPQMPTPTRAQAISGIRHFRAIQEQLGPILAAPDLGRVNMKPKIIEGVTNLVSARYMSPADAVMQLASVPEKPIEQRKWAQQHFDQAGQAMELIMEHFAAGAGEDDGIPSMDDHGRHVTSLMDAYKGVQRG